MISHRIALYKKARSARLRSVIAPCRTATERAGVQILFFTGSGLFPVKKKAPLSKRRFLFYFFPIRNRSDVALISFTIAVSIRSISISSAPQ